MRLSEKIVGGVCVIQLNGRLDASTAAETEKAIGKQIDSGGRKVVLVLSGVEYISSAGLRVLLVAAKQLQKLDGQLALARLSSAVEDVLKLTGFAAIIPVCRSVEEASAMLSGKALAAKPEGPVLTIAEEIYLIALDEQEGKIRPNSQIVLDYVIAGALLMELSLGGYIETDTESLRISGGGYPNDPLLKSVMQQVEKQKSESVTWWLRHLSQQSGEIERQVLASLIGKGVLKQEKHKVLWVFNLKHYSLNDRREVKEVRTRLRDLIEGNEIPEPHDAVLLSLGYVSRMLLTLFSAEEYHRHQPRIEALASLDLIGQEMKSATEEIERAIALAPSIMI